MYKNVYLLIILTIFCFILTGCDDSVRKQAFERINASISACMNNNGVPILNDSFPYEMKECVFNKYE